MDENGRITAEQVKNALTDKTVLVSVMYGNNEVGTIQPIREIGALLKESPSHFPYGCSSSLWTIPLNADELGVDLLSVSAHKLNGPKGIGFLYQRKGLRHTSFIRRGTGT